MKQIAVLTSGGDSPGMNACIRAVVRRGVDLGMLVWGVRRGYAGLLADEMEVFTARDVSGILHRGGTILGTARCPEFTTTAGRQHAMSNCRRHGIEGLVVIGGDGSLAGAQALHQMEFPVVGVPGSIDNDLWGTDHAIGVDTALNVILATVDRVRDTADAMGRAVLVEVMGRHAGYLAALSGMTCGAEMVAIPREHSTHDGFIAAVRAQMREARARGKSHFILILAEGVVKDDLQTTTSALEETLRAEYARGRLPYEPRSLVVGYQQRGGVSTHWDRRLATELGAAAAERLRDGTSGVMVGKRGERVVDHPLHEVLEKSGRPLTNLDRRVLELARILAS